MSLEIEALKLLNKGLTIIPLRGRYGVNYDDAKRPIVKWEKWQGRKPDAFTVKSWFEKKPDIDIGILTGSRAGLFVVDADGPEGVETAKKLGIDQTVVNVTPRGLQYLLAWDERLNGLPTNLVKPFDDMPGIDTRGEGGYIVAPPSTNLGDKLYSWKDGVAYGDIKLASIPEALVQRLVERAAKEYADAPEVSTDSWLVELKKGVSQGQNRHRAMTRLASFYMSRGIPQDDVEALLLAWNQRCTPPKPEAEFILKVREFLENWSDGKYRSTYKAPTTKFEVKKSNDFLNSGEKEIDWLVDRLIPVETIGFLHGYGGQGKSWLTLDLAIEVGRGGGKWLDRFPTVGGKVLYIDEESHPTLLRNRYNKLIKGKGLTPDQVDVSFLSLQELKLDNQDTLEAFRGLLVELKPTLVIIDPFVAIHGMNENSTEQMAKLRGILKGLIKDTQVAFFFIDHESKPSEFQKSAAQRQRGSTEKDAVADVKLAISNNQKLPNEIGFKAMIEHSKARFGVTEESFIIGCVDVAEGSVIRYEGKPDFSDVI